MKLTNRQIDFLAQLRSLQSENNGDPVHYSLLAERLDISNGTAYHMLRVLENKGCLISRYQLPEVRVGRSSVVFELSEIGRKTLAAASARVGR